MTAPQEPPTSITHALSTQAIALEQQALLDLIDQIQHAQIEGIKLPQIVVVGDQSSGKSSVLEAVTGIPFPRDAGACTRFATEFRLRRSNEEKFNVKILADKERPAEQCKRLREFAASVTKDDDVETVLRRAVNEIAPQGIQGRFAAKDVLVIEKSAPDLPLLTVVDLPGLVAVVNIDQSEEDTKAIDDLTNRYMKSSRTIILAIIGGNHDYVQQKVLTKAKYFDPKGDRTIGVLTKPDIIREIGLEEKFIALVNNQDIHNQFKLGWYVLRNPGPQDLGRQWTPEQRQRQEDEFFSQEKWSVIPPGIRGPNALKQKLSRQLVRHIARYIPKLRRELQDKLAQTEADLESLGTGKDTIPEMRQELLELSHKSSLLIKSAVDGTYKNLPGKPGKKFFPKMDKKPDPKGPTPPQNLRARVVKENECFANMIVEQGKDLNVISRSVSGHFTESQADVSKEAYAKEKVEPFLRDHVGSEFAGDYNALLVFSLFQQFSDNWGQLARDHSIRLGKICNEFLAEVIDDVWPEHMREKLRKHFLDPQILEISEKASQEVNNLSEDQTYEVKSYDPEYGQRFALWCKTASADLDRRPPTSAEELLEKALIHYDLSAKIFISNVIIQVIERHLLRGIDDLFSSVKIGRLQDQEIENIALDSIETRERRTALKATRQAIKKSLEDCSNMSSRKELRRLVGDTLNPLEDNSDDGQAHVTATLQRKPLPRESATEINPTSQGNSRYRERPSQDSTTPTQNGTPVNGPSTRNRNPDAVPELTSTSNSGPEGLRAATEWSDATRAGDYRTLGTPLDLNHQAASPAPYYPPPQRTMTQQQTNVHQRVASPQDSLLPANLADRRESLSGYAYPRDALNAPTQAPYEIGDGQASTRRRQNRLPFLNSR